MYFLLGDDENVLDSGGICELDFNYLEREETKAI